MISKDSAAGYVPQMDVVNWQDAGSVAMRRIRQKTGDSGGKPRN
jgi:hypothetical protein